MKEMLAKYKQEKRATEVNDKQRQLKANWMKRERSMVAKGKKPFYLKKSDQKKLMLADKYLALKKEGGLEKALIKRRRKNANKDHRWMPRGGPGAKEATKKS